MKTRYWMFGVGIIALAFAAACSSPLSPSGGTLTISVADNINAKTILPALSMDAQSFTISGSGPGGASFSGGTSGGSVTFDRLAFGTWTVTVNAYNGANGTGTKIGSGTGSTYVHSGTTTALPVTVTPLSGTGTLDLTVTWPSAQVDGTPSIVASLVDSSGAPLTDSSGTPVALNFGVSGGTATLPALSVPTGYWTLVVQLLSSGNLIMGGVEVVRIVKDQPTSGALAFTNVNQPGGSLVVTLTPQLANPIAVSLAGLPSSFQQGTSVPVSAVIAGDTTGFKYMWYLNGVVQPSSTGPDFTIDSSLPVGYYQLTVVVFSSDGTQAGSMSGSFQITSVIIII